MTDRNIKDKISPLSSRMIKSKSIPLLFKKVKSERNPRKKVIIKYSFIEKETPSYQNKFSFNRNISSSSSITSLKVLNSSNFHKNIYQDVHLINTNSFNNNSSEIRKMIRERKYNSFKKIYNMFFNTPFSNEFMNDFNAISKRRIIFTKRKNILMPIKRNNSCEELINSKINIKNIIRNDEYTPRLSTNCSKIMNTNLSNNKNSKIVNTQISKKQLKYNNSNFSATTNESQITSKILDKKQNSNIGINEDSITNSQNNIILPKLPILQLQNQNIIESENLVPDIQKNVGSFLTEITTEKIYFNINQLRIDNIKGKEKIEEFEESILKLKIFQTYQREYLEKILKDEKFHIQERIDYIIKMYKIYENIYNDYLLNLNQYNNFLFNVSNELEIELRMINQNKRDINYEMEKICDKIIVKQKEFEYLINTRNFLFSVKNKGKNIIKLNNAFVHKISKRKILAEKLLDIFGRNEESYAFKNLKKLIPIEQLEKMTKVRAAKARLINRLAHTIRNTLSKAEQNKNELMPPPPGEKIFETPEEFIKILNNMTNIDLDLMYDYEKIKIEKNKLLNELNEYIALFKEFEKSDSNIYLIKDNKYLKEEKEKNIKLSKQYHYKNDLLNKKKELSSLKLDFKIYSFKAFNNIYYYNIIKYNKLRIKYKLEGLVLLEKLINNINQIMTINNESNIFDKENIYNYIPKNNLEQILDIKKDYFDKNNQFLIKEYTLKLIKLYEFLGEFIIIKNKESKKRNNELYNKVRDKVTNERKIYNANLIKKMFVEKRDLSTKELVERWNKKIIKGLRKSDLENNYSINQSQKIKKTKLNFKKADEEFDENNLYYEE